MTETLEVSIVMPCLNEEETLGRCIEKAQRFLRDNVVAGEVIVADNGSTDRSVDIATRLQARIVHQPVRGYGAALMAGIEAAHGQFVVMGDADDSYDFSALMPFIEQLRRGYDLVMGCRFPIGGGRIMPGAMPWSHRWLGNPVLSATGRLFFHCPVRDLYCGMRAFRTEAVRAFNLRTTGMEFAYEMLIKANFRGLSITEIPITLYKDGRSRPPHLRTWQDGWRTLRFMLLYSPRWLFLIPGLTLACLGALLSGILLMGPVQIGRAGFDANTLLITAMALLVGFQLIVFATFTKVFGVVEGLLPPSPRLERLTRWITLEVGICVGILVSLVGLSLLVAGVLYWGAHDFGPISYPLSLRIVIPGVTACTLGVEIIFSSFFLSILSLSRK